jgi:aspartyl-tRNA(Asn)/glutamyl-tRNA(Gln) amidotransferase subunit C
MRLSYEEVTHIAELARLKLTEDEKQQFAEQLSDILDYASRLDSLDTHRIPPTASVLDRYLRLREDEVQPGLNRSQVLQNAPAIKDNQFKVPPVFGE